MNDFPHLKLLTKIEGKAKIQSGRSKKQPRTIANILNRLNHAEYLRISATNLVEKWNELLRTRRAEGAGLPNETDIPIFLQIDTEVFKLESFDNWGIEIISEEEDGYIIGACTDGFESFQKKIEEFLNHKGRSKDKAAQIWELETDESWRIRKLLKGELGKIWDKIEENSTYTIQLGIACYVQNKDEYPVRDIIESVTDFTERVDAFNAHEIELQVKRDAIQILRENEIEQYISIYNAALHESWDNQVDAIFFKMSINGKGLKDLVQTYQYLFEVKLEPNYSIEYEESSIYENYNLDIIPPENSAGKVCIIDSGIQENHRLIQSAIDSLNSNSYVEGDVSTADYVKQNGHGTKVAGAVLYPSEIPKSGRIKLETIIQNARILDNHNKISSDRFEPKLMQQIVLDYPDTKIFNLSVSENGAYIGTHMPSLAASIDKLIHENDILFIISAGNIAMNSQSASSTSIADYLISNKNYPSYLNEIDAKIANPGVSLFGITVGSIAKEDFENEDYKAMAGNNFVSPFSRSGPGMWDSIKPDVVEFGGDLLKNKHSLEIITHELTSPELINSTLYGASAVGRDTVGTSFSTPKVSYIASKLQSVLPDESAQMYRALIIQSARLPEHCFHQPDTKDFQYYGYGIPDVNRALNNSESRITFIQNGKLGPRKADIYDIKIPQELKGEGKEFRILMEITLSFTAKTRITRKGAHSYLSNWLEWQSSNYNEDLNSFCRRTINYLGTVDELNDSKKSNKEFSTIKWIIRTNPKWSDNGINRNKSTVQKSWTFIEPYQFTEEFSVAVIGHKGWDNNLEHEIPYALCISFEVFDTQLNIYDLLAQAQVEIEPEIET